MVGAGRLVRILSTASARRWAGMLGLLALWPASLGAWGMDVHREITGRAIDGLPADARAFFSARRAFIAEHSVDPDLWRVAGLGGAMGPEPPNHFLDIDGGGDATPFSGVPRDRDAFIAKYGTERAEQLGRLPWRVVDVYDQLVKALRQAHNGSSPYAKDDAMYLAAVLAHYVEDAAVPFHAVVNYDGQLTGQKGIHSRFENDLVLRNTAKLVLRSVDARSIADVRAFIFDRLVSGVGAATDVLKADRDALTTGGAYDDTYYERFFKGARPVLEARLSDAADGVASLLRTAWEEAARPPLSAN